MYDASTIMILSLPTDWSGQTVQTQIRLLLIRVFTVCYFTCIFSTKYPNVCPLCLNFRMITKNFFDIRKFRNFTVVSTSEIAVAV